MQMIPVLIITHHPMPEFFEELPVLLAQFEKVIIVDNASAEKSIDRLKQVVAQNNKDNLIVFFNSQNLGIASALNQGFRWAMNQGYEFLFVLDQDSRITSNLIHELLSAYETHLHRERLAIISPSIVDELTGELAPVLCWKDPLLEKRLSQSEILEDVAVVITSGSLNILSAYQQIGPFREDFFIDYVDTEYCLRSHTNGYEIAVACKAVLYHRLGKQQKKQIGSLILRPTFHSPRRWYYIQRNRIIMYSLYFFRLPVWVVYDFFVGVYAFLKMLLYEDYKSKKILATFLGVIDGLTCRMGAISTNRLSQIEPPD